MGEMFSNPLSDVSRLSSLSCHASGSEDVPCEVRTFASAGWHPERRQIRPGVWEWQAPQDASILVQVIGGIEVFRGVRGALGLDSVDLSTEP